MEKGFRLGHWIVWPQQDRIDDHGETIHITPKSMAVLECLARAQGEVVPRNDILDAVRPGADVTDDALTHSVTELRKAFGDSPHDPGVIETIPKKGLRLMLEAAWSDESKVQSGDAGGARSGVSAISRMGPLLVVLAIIAAVFATHYFFGRDGEVQTGTAEVERSIAVLPFVDMSADKHQQYLADGLAEELADRLSRIQGLLVYARWLEQEATDAEADQRPDRPRYAAEYLLNGSVRKSEDQLRITAALVGARDGLQIWSHTFDRPYADIFAIQAEIAEAVAMALRAELGVGAPSMRVGGTSNIAAYEHVLRGDYAMDFTAEGMDSAIAHYRSAVELDPDYAIGWQRIAATYEMLPFVEGSSTADRYYEHADQTIARALALAPDSRDVLLVAAGRQLSKRNWIAARETYDRALEVNADAVDRLLGDTRITNVHLDMHLKPGYMVEMVNLIERATRVRTLGQNYSAHLPNAYLSFGWLDDALAEIERVFAQPKNKHTNSQTGVHIAMAIGDEELIRKWLTRALKHEMTRRKGATEALLETLGDRERTLAWLREAYAAGSDLDDLVMLWAAYHGDDDLVLKAMQRSLDFWFFWSPLMARARGTEEFKNIVRDAGLVDYWRRYGWNDFCAPTAGEDFECG